MDTDLTKDQDLLVETSMRFVESAYPLTTVRERSGSGAEGGSDYLTKAAELGWFSMLVPEELGGGSVSGNAVVDAALLATVRGGLLQPGSFVGTNVAAYALACAGSPDQRSKILPALLAGTETATWAWAGPEADGSPSAGVRADVDSGVYRLSGVKTLVQEASSADWILITAPLGNRLSQFLVPAGTAGLRVEELHSLDPTRRFSRITLDDVELPPSALVGDEGTAGDLVEQQVDIASVLTVAESVGAMDRDFAMALQYAKDRTAFGRPIGSFQAIKHQLADTSLRLEMSKAVSIAAARAVGEKLDEASAAASIAKAFVGDAGIDLAQSCFQVFGGIGFTWEHDQHLYMRRLTTDAALYGDPSWHRERLCRLGGL